MATPLSRRRVHPGLTMVAGSAPGFSITCTGTGLLVLESVLCRGAVSGFHARPPRRTITAATGVTIRKMVKRRLDIHPLADKTIARSLSRSPVLPDLAPAQRVFGEASNAASSMNSARRTRRSSLAMSSHVTWSPPVRRWMRRWRRSSRRMRYSGVHPGAITRAASVTHSEGRDDGDAKGGSVPRSGAGPGPSRRPRGRRRRAGLRRELRRLRRTTRPPARMPGCLSPHSTRYCSRYRTCNFDLRSRGK